MLTLNATDTLSAVAGTASAITYTFMGDNVVTGTDNFGGLPQGQLPSSVGTIWSATPGQTIGRLMLANTTGSTVTDIKIFKNGTIASNQITATFSLAGNTTASVDDTGLKVMDSNGSLITTAAVTLTGDVTGSGAGSIATTIPAGTIDNPRMANMAQATFKMRAAAAGTGVPIDGTPTQAKTALAITSGDVSGLAAVATSGSATDLTTGTLAVGRLPALTGDVTEAIGTGVTALTNIPNDTTAAGDILNTNITAPSTPTSGKTKTYIDSTSKNFAAKNDAGVVNHGIQTKNAVSHQFLTAIADDGSSTLAQPAASDVSGLATVATSGSASDLTTGTLAVGRLPALTGDVTEAIGTGVTALTNIPNDTTQAGDILATNITAPATPASGKTRTYIDSTSKNFAAKNDAGTVNHGVQTKAAAAHNFLTSIADDGSSVLAQPAASDVTGLATVATSGSATDLTTGTLPAGRLPALTGDVSSSAGSASVTVTKLQGSGVVSTVPLIGQTIDYRSGGWTPTFHHYNVIGFGADPTAGVDSTLSIFNTCAMSYFGPTVTAASIVTSSTQVTTGATFTLAIVSATIPSTGTLIAQTTLGPLLFTYTGGGAGVTSLACTAVTTGGVTGGIILAGSLAAPQSASSIGGTVYFPAGIYLLSYPIIISTNGVALVGDSAAANNDVSNYTLTGGSWLKSSTAVNPLTSASAFCLTPGTNGADTPLVRAVPFINASGGALTGLAVHNLNADCRGNIGSGTGNANGFEFISVHSPDLRNLFVIDPIHWGYQFTCLKAGSLGEAQDCTRGILSNIRWRCVEQAAGGASTGTTSAVTNVNALSNSTLAMSATTTSWPATGYLTVQAIDQITGNVMDYLCSYTGGANTATMTGVTCLGVFNNAPNGTAGGGAPSALMFSTAKVAFADAGHATGIRHHGSLGANSNLHKCDNLIGLSLNGCGVYYGNADNITTDNLVVNSTGTAFGADFQCASVIGGAPATARNNQHYGGSPGKNGAILRGTGDYNGTMATGAASTPNYWHNQQISNGEAAVTVGIGCFAGGGIWTYNGTPVVPAPIYATPAAFTTVTTILAQVSCLAGTLRAEATYRMTAWVQYTAAAGTAAEVYSLLCGTAGTTADAVLTSITTGLATAANSAVKIEGVFSVKTISNSTGTIVGYVCGLSNGVIGAQGTSPVAISPGANNFATNLGQIATLNTLNGNLFISLAMKSGSTSQTFTPELVYFEQIQ